MHMMKLKLSKPTIAIVVMLLGAVIFFLSVNPGDLPLVALIGPFIYVFVFLFLCFYQLFKFFRFNNLKLASLIPTILIAVLLVMSSLHQITIKDVIIGVTLTVILSWYITRHQS